jgi:hypothetical protein
MNPAPCRGALALTLVLAIFLFVLPSPVRAAGAAELAGRVLQPDGITPRSGVVVTLFDPATDQTYSSEPTTAEGAFHIEQAPAGTYSLVAESEGGAYLAADELRLDEGSNPPLALTLQTAPGQTTDQQQSNMKPWAKWLIAGSIIVVGLFLVYEVTKDAETDGSPY